MTSHEQIADKIAAVNELAARINNYIDVEHDAIESVTETLWTQLNNKVADENGDMSSAVLLGVGLQIILNTVHLIVEASPPVDDGDDAMVEYTSAVSLVLISMAEINKKHKAGTKQ